jgi:hypothetical protein
VPDEVRVAHAPVEHKEDDPGGVGDTAQGQPSQAGVGRVPRAWFLRAMCPERDPQGTQCLFATCAAIQTVAGSRRMFDVHFRTLPPPPLSVWTSVVLTRNGEPIPGIFQIVLHAGSNRISAGFNGRSRRWDVPASAPTPTPTPTPTPKSAARAGARLVTSPDPESRRWHVGPDASSVSTRVW